MSTEIRIFTARKIITMNPTRPEGTAVAVRDGRILGIGTLAELKGWGKAEIDDRFRDKVIIPGLIEVHSHVMEGAFWLFSYVGYFDRTAPDGTVWKGCRSVDEVVATLTQIDASMVNPSEPLIAWGLDPIYFEGTRLNAGHLDRVSLTRPIFIQHANGHLATVNTALLNQYGISRQTDVEGVAKDSTGEPTGELREPKAMALTGAIYHQIHAACDTDEAWWNYGLQAKNAGCTMVGELGAAQIHTPEGLERISRVVNDPDFPTRMAVVYAMLFNGPSDLTLAVQQALELKKRNSSKLRYGVVKLFLDGSIQGYTARLRAPGYYTRETEGIWLTPPEIFPGVLEAFHKQGLTVHCHCNGEEAVDVFLDAVEHAQAKSHWPDHRHTIQHCQLTTRDQYQRMANLGVCANIFSNHLYYWGDQHRDLTVGPDRAKRMEACATARDLGVHFSLHCDAPVTPFGQLHTAWCAVNRLTASGDVLGTREAISVYEALHAVTLDAAYQLKLDREMGSIEPGKLADFTILEEDPFAVAPVKLKEIPIWGTVLGGQPQPVLP